MSTVLASRPGSGTSARFNVAFVPIGLSGCDIGVSWLLPRLIGASRAWELLLTGRIIDSAEADRIGLATFSDDMREAMGAFLQKRPPQFRNA